MSSSAAAAAPDDDEGGEGAGKMRPLPGIADDGLIAAAAATKY